MKKKLLTIATVIGIFLGGGVIGYAASLAFNNLDAIRTNFDTVFQYGKTKAQRVTELESQLSQNTNTQDQLKAEIERIKADKDKAVADKQKEIDAKQKEVDAKQQEADALRQQLDASKSEKEQLEQKIDELKRYTDQKVGELK